MDNLDQLLDELETSGRHHTVTGATGMVYHDVNGLECSLDTMCLRHPEWAASRLRAQAQDLDAQTQEIAALDKERNRLVAANEGWHLRVGSLKAEVSAMMEREGGLCNNEEAMATISENPTSLEPSTVHNAILSEYCTWVASIVPLIQEKLDTKQYKISQSGLGLVLSLPDKKMFGRVHDGFSDARKNILRAALALVDPHSVLGEVLGYVPGVYEFEVLSKTELKSVEQIASAVIIKVAEMKEDQKKVEREKEHQMLLEQQCRNEIVSLSDLQCAGSHISIGELHTKLSSKGFGSSLVDQATRQLIERDPKTWAVEVHGSIPILKRARFSNLSNTSQRVDEACQEYGLHDFKLGMFLLACLGAAALGSALTYLSSPW